MQAKHLGSIHRRKCLDGFKELFQAATFGDFVASVKTKVVTEHVLSEPHLANKQVLQCVIPSERKRTVKKIRLSRIWVKLQRWLEAVEQDEASTKMQRAGMTVVMYVKRYPRFGLDDEMIRPR